MLTETQIELHNARKARLARINRAVAHRAACAKAAQVVSKTTELEEYLSTITKPKPQQKRAKPTGHWFSMVEDLQPEQDRKFSITEIKHVVCSHFGITQLELLSKRRAHKVMIPRQIAMHLSKKLTGRSLPEIGRMFGGMDHTTVLNAARVTEKRARDDWRVAFDIAHIEGMLA